MQRSHELLDAYTHMFQDIQDGRLTSANDFLSDSDEVSAIGCPLERMLLETIWTAPRRPKNGDRSGAKIAGTDASARSVNQKTVVPSTIFHLRTLPAPSSLPVTSRVKPVETTVYSYSPIQVSQFS
jgi:hypothetical protein